MALADPDFKVSGPKKSTLYEHFNGNEPGVVHRRSARRGTASARFAAGPDLGSGPRPPLAAPLPPYWSGALRQAAAGPPAKGLPRRCLPRDADFCKTLLREISARASSRERLARRGRLFTRRCGSRGDAVEVIRFPPIRLQAVCRSPKIPLSKTGFWRDRFRYPMGSAGNPHEALSGRHAARRIRPAGADPPEGGMIRTPADPAGGSCSGRRKSRS